MQDLARHSQNIRRKIIETAGTRFSAHFGGSLSSVDVLSALFGKIMNISAEKATDPNRDRFILSKGHCALGLYAALNEFGFISDEDLSTFDKDAGSFPTHCVQSCEKGIEISSGSLGLGLSMAVGIALALKAKKSSAKVYVLCGNGEANEGIFWEAVMFAGVSELNNLILILDNNKMQNDGFSKEVMDIKNWDERLKAFGWNICNVDGHNLEALINQLKTPSAKEPLAIIASTVKGKGVTFMENNPEWHHNKLSPEQYEKALSEVSKTGE